MELKMFINMSYYVLQIVYFLIICHTVFIIYLVVGLGYLQKKFTQAEEVKIC
jgi:hypothetical protein